MGFEGSTTTTAVLGMDGFVLVGAEEIDAELVMTVETTVTKVGCPACGTRAQSKGRREVAVRDTPSGGRAVRLVWRKRLWRCPDSDCDTKTWSESTTAIAPRASLSHRAKADICTQVGRHARSVAAVARDYGVGWDTAMGAVEELGRPLVDDPDRIHPVQTLGADETSFRAGKASSHRTSYVTGLVDTQEAFLLDVIEGRDAADLDKWLGVQDQQWLEGVTSVAIDLHEGFRHGLVGHLDHATLVADPFHVVAAANRRVDQVRRRVQNEILGHRGRRDDPLYRIRRILLCAHERLSDSGRKRMDVGLGGGDPRDEVLGAWLAKEAVRSIYLTDDPTEAAILVDVAIAECADSEVPEVVSLGKTLARWRPEILAHHTTGASNGPTEGLNLLVKKIKRTGHGFRSFKNYRLRLLLHCGVSWQAPPTARMRGRYPRLAA